jgi:hypothetical protein
LYLTHIAETVDLIQATVAPAAAPPRPAVALDGPLGWTRAKRRLWPGKPATPAGPCR